MRVKVHRSTDQLPTAIQNKYPVWIPFTTKIGFSGISLFLCHRYI